MVIKELTYKVPEMSNGYANQTLYINLDNYEIKIEEVTDEMKDKFNVEISSKIRKNRVG